ncbi:MAG: type II toxin-antitoxin system RelE/ParE family toxin [Ginsengibacter sp.]
MSYPYQFHDIAQDEYETSVQWYLEKSEKAALGFVNAVDVALIKIGIYPLRYRNTYKHFYEIGLNKYPFVIIYSIEGEENKVIIIWRVFHYKRDPRKKYSGLTG